MLTACSSIPLRDGGHVLDLLCDHMRGHGEVEQARGTATIRLDYGRADLAISGDGLDVVVSASDATGLSYMKMGVVHHVRAFSAPQTPDIGWHGDGTGETVPAFFREMRVVAAFDVTRHMRRVVLAGERLDRFAEGGLHVRLLFPPKGRALVWPRLGGDGCPVWPDGADAVTARVYTLRHVDLEAGEVFIDIFRHDGDATPGSDFALTARPGDRVGMTGPGGGGVPAASALLLLGDETALPAIARILAALPASATARAVIEVGGTEDRQPMPSAASVSLEWMYRGAGQPGGTGRLADVLDRLAPEDLAPDTFVWAGCEFEDFRRMRRRLRSDWKLPRDRHLVVAYWRKGAAGDVARADA